MRSLEDLCTVDVPSIVCSIRHDRGAAVLLREHYAFIYKVGLAFKKTEALSDLASTALATAVAKGVAKDMLYPNA